MTLRRGLKAEAEREAVEARRQLGLAPHDPLDPAELARYQGIEVLDASTLIDVSELEDLEKLQAFAFSAATFDIKDKKVIVFNPLRSSARRNSDVAHELAHVMLKHDLSEVRDLGGITFRTCRPDEEEEATVFGGTLLLPRPLLLSAARRKATIEQIATQYEVTIEMARFRYNSTGVARQLGHGSSKE